MHCINEKTVFQVLFLLAMNVNCDRYEYLLFENFEMTQRSFITEHKMVKKPSDEKRDLVSTKVSTSKRNGYRFRSER